MLEFPAWLISGLALIVLGLLVSYRPIPWRWRISLGVQLIFLSVIYLVIEFSNLTITDARLLSRLSIFTVLVADFIVLTILHRGGKYYG